jgi:hypothetical protein
LIVTPRGTLHVYEEAYNTAGIEYVAGVPDGLEADTSKPQAFEGPVIMPGVTGADLLTIIDLVTTWLQLLLIVTEIIPEVKPFG